MLVEFTFFFLQQAVRISQWVQKLGGRRYLKVAKVSRKFRGAVTEAALDKGSY